MGFEYKILLNLAPQQCLDLQHVLLEQIGFSQKSNLEKDYIKFRYQNNLDPKYIQNLYLLFEANGIYICNHSITPIWDNLYTIKNFLEKHHLAYHILDYSD